ncbi:MAG: pilus assembly protein TadG-related protein [Myxococcales bacterium]|jgi:Flp pilus assembly protein TadG
MPVRSAVSPSRRREGAVAVVVVFAMIAMLAAATIAVDVGHVYKVRTELQATADAAAHAGATRLDGTDTGIDAAAVTAKNVAAENRAHFGGTTVRVEDVVFGTWANNAGTFTPVAEPKTVPSVINAVRVTAHADGDAGSPVRAFFGSFIGHDQTDVSAISTAVGGGPVAECGFPMAVPQCALSQVPSDTCGFCFQFQSNGVDTAGWTTLDPDMAVNVPNVAALINESCFDETGTPSIDPVTRECTGGCTNTSTDVGGEVQVNNGNGIIGAGNGGQPCDLISQILLRDGEPAQSFRVRVPTIDNGGDCANYQFSNTHTVVGFAEIEITGVGCGGSNPDVIDPDFPVDPTTFCGPPSGAYVRGVLNCDGTSTEPGGGGFPPNNVTTTRIRLVE